MALFPSHDRPVNEIDANRDSFNGERELLIMFRPTKGQDR
jgi:hypothetical protein